MKGPLGPGEGQSAAQGTFAETLGLASHDKALSILRGSRKVNGLAKHADTASLAS